MTKPKITQKERELYTRQKDKTKFDTPEEEYIYARETKKKCSKCNEMKNLTEYSGNTSGCDGFDKDGFRLRRPECKNCNKKIRKGKNEAKVKAKELNIRCEAPEGAKCALCHKLEKNGDKLVFDHCHETNTFRGYLHNSCNRALGILGDDADGMTRALNYVNKTQKKKFTQDKDTAELMIQD